MQNDRPRETHIHIHTGEVDPEVRDAILQVRDMLGKIQKTERTIMRDLDQFLLDLQDETDARVALTTVLDKIEADLAAAKNDPVKVAAIRKFIADNKAAMVAAALKGTQADADANPVSKVDPSTASLAVGGTQQLAVDDKDGNDVTSTSTFTADDPTIASVSTSGLVTGVAVGSTNITAKDASGTTLGTCAVTVA